MGQGTSATMGATLSAAQENRMKQRIRQCMSTFSELGAHIEQANEWARLCPTPKSCYLSMRLVLNDRISSELMPYVWKIRGNVQIEVRKLRRPTEPMPTVNDLFTTTLSSVTARNRQQHNVAPDACIGQAKVLTLRQFYFVYCFLSDIKACAAHTVQFPERPSTPHARDSTAHVSDEFDETECQICMDKKKQVVLPCTHSFCLTCFQHWSAQHNTCPICRTEIECSEGSDLWQLTCGEIKDIGSYATDLVSRIFEFLDKRPVSAYSEAEIQRSSESYVTASAIKTASVSPVTIPTSTFRLGMSSLLGSSMLHTIPTEVDADFVVALEVASGEDQFAAFRQYEQMRQDQVLAMTIAMQVDDEDEEDL